MSSFAPKCRQPVGHALMQAGSRPCDTRSVQSVDLNIFLVAGLNLGMLKGHPVTQYWQPIQNSCWKSTMPFWYCTMALSAGILRSEEQTSELQSHSFISYAVFFLKKKKT